MTKRAIRVLTAGLLAMAVLAVGPTEADAASSYTVRPGDTRFTADYQEYQRNVAEFNAQAKKKDSGAKAAG